MTRPSLSVIIPTYNRTHTLPRALNSVLAQSYSATEIIVIDDGSSDGSAALIEREYPQVKLISQNNRGVSAARNRGIREATGRWLAFLDSDDEWLPHKLEQQLTLAAEYPDHKIVHSDEIWIRDGVRVNAMHKHKKKGGYIFQHCLPLCAISPSAAILQQQLLADVGLFDETLPVCEDYDLWLRITAHHPVLYCEEPLIIKYGGHTDQLSRHYWGMDRFRIQALVKCLEKNGLNNADTEAAKKILLKKITIYLKGARKRKKQCEIEYYERLLNKWSDRNR